MASPDTQSPAHPHIPPGDHQSFIAYAVQQARLSPPGPDKFCVGAVLANGSTGEVLSTGYSMELPSNLPDDPGNTHAEQCCFIKLALLHALPAARAEEHIRSLLPAHTVLYTTMEPCNARLSGNRTCCDRIVALKERLRTVYVGMREPGTFVRENDGRGRLEGEGVGFEMVEGMDGICCEVAMSGHAKEE